MKLEEGLLRFTLMVNDSGILTCLHLISQELGSQARAITPSMRCHLYNWVRLHGTRENEADTRLPTSNLILTANC